MPLGTALRREQALEGACNDGESTPDPEGSGNGGEDPSHINSEFSSDSSGSRQACTCGFCDGFEVEYSETDPRTGEVEERSFKKASQKERCPRCGGYNLNWRKRFIAHCASVGKRLGRKRRVFFVSFVLIRAAAEQAGLDTDDSYEVLKDLWDKVRRGIKRRADDVDYSGVLATRPSDGRYHGHVLIYASLTRYELMRAFHVRGLDTYIETADTSAAAKASGGRSPEEESSSGGHSSSDWKAKARFGMPKDEGMDAERFAAKKGAYIWENAAASKNSRYTSSRGNGAGYNSKEARRRRRKAANGRNDGNGESAPGGDGEPPPGDPSPRLNGNGRSGNGGGGQGNGDPGGGDPGPNRGNDRNRAPPVDCGGGSYPDLEDALSAAKSAFTRRVGTKVTVVDEGSAELLKVYREEDRLTCVIVPDWHSATVTVPWDQVEVVNPPKIRPGSSGPTNYRNDPNKDQNGSGNAAGGSSSGSGSSRGSTPPDSGNGDSDGDGATPDGDDPSADGADGGNADKDDSDKDEPDGDTGGGQGGASDDDGDITGDDDDGDDGGRDDDGGDDGGGDDGGGDDGGGDKSDNSRKGDPSERFQEAADKSVVQTELPSQQRLKTVFDYATGKARTSVLPPQHSPSG